MRRKRGRAHPVVMIIRISVFNHNNETSNASHHNNTDDALAITRMTKYIYDTNDNASSKLADDTHHHLDVQELLCSYGWRACVRAYAKAVALLL